MSDTTYKILNRKPSVLKQAKDYYDLFFVNGKFDKEKASITLGKFNDTDRRVEIIERVYKSILDASYISDITKIWISNSGSIETAVELYKIKKKDNELTIDSGKSKVNYDIIKVKGCMYIPYGDSFRSIFDMLLNFDNITDEEWGSFEDKIKEFILGSATRELKTSDMLISINKKLINDHCDNDKFKEFLKLISPYSRSVKNKIQSLINECEEECGYFNFLFGDTSELNEEDEKFKTIIKDWLKGTTMEDKKVDKVGMVPQYKVKEFEKMVKDFEKRKEDLEKLVHAINDRSDSLALKEKDFDFRVKDLELKEQALKEKEQALNEDIERVEKRKASIESSAQKLAKLEEILNERERRLK